MHGRTGIFTNATWAAGVARSRPCSWTAIKVPSGRRWLDVGCGTGALSAAILERGSPSSVVGVDPSQGFRDTARDRLGERVSLLPGSATAIPLGDASVDVVVSGLVLNFVPDQPAALAEMKRVVAPGGTIAAYVWDYAEKMELMRHFWDAAISLDASVAQLDELVRFPVCRPEPLRAVVRRCWAAGHRSQRHRHRHALCVLRRLLGAVPGRAGARAVLCHVAGRSCKAATARHAEAAHCGEPGWLDRNDRQSVGGSGHGAWRRCRRRLSPSGPRCNPSWSNHEFRVHRRAATHPRCERSRCAAPSTTSTGCARTATAVSPKSCTAPWPMAAGSASASRPNTAARAWAWPKRRC